MYFVPLKTPVMVEAYEAFIAANPWVNGQQVRWTVGGMRWGSKRPHDIAETNSARAKGVRPKGIWAGLQSSEAKVRVLPDAVQDLYWKGDLPAREIPWLLHELAPEPTQGGGVVVRSQGWDQVDTKGPLIMGGGIILLVFWLLGAATAFAICKTGFTQSLHKLPWFAWLCVLIFVGVPVIMTTGMLRARTANRELRA